MHRSTPARQGRLTRQAHTFSVEQQHVIACSAPYDGERLLRAVAFQAPELVVLLPIAPLTKRAMHGARDFPPLLGESLPLYVRQFTQFSLPLIPNNPRAARSQNQSRHIEKRALLLTKDPLTPHMQSHPCFHQARVGPIPQQRCSYMEYRGNSDPEVVALYTRSDRTGGSSRFAKKPVSPWLPPG